MESGKQKTLRKEIIRRHIRFFGWVQGVGFRWRARQAASLHGCTGWVRNEYDGSVSMEIQGEPEQIERVIAAIEAGRYVQIERMETMDISPVTDERDFRSE